MRVHGAAARETDGGRCFAEGCRWLYGFGEGVDYTEAASYLKREVDILTVLQHPNIIHYYESFKFGDALYIVMELVEGGA